MKKKILAMLLAAVLAVDLLPGTAWAADSVYTQYAVTGGNIYLSSYNDAGTWTITGADFAITAAVIPSEINGIPVTSIDADCTRADAVKYIWQVFGREDAASNGRFTDVDDSADYLTAVYWAAANGITAGDDSPTLFCPTKTCTRGHIVTFLHRAYVPEVRIQ